MAKRNGNAKQETAIVPAKQYKIVTHHERAVDILKTNIGPGGITERDLTQIRIPAGGGLQWCIPTLEGDKYVDAFYGVPLMFLDERAHWSIPYSESGGGGPPDCKSCDLMHGVGTPGGDCDSCEKNKWTDTKTGRKECTINRALFICGPDDFIPFVLAMPITSRKECISFFVKLSQFGLQHFEAILKFTLVEAVNKSGIKYSKVEIEKEETLPEELAGRMQIISEGMKKVLGGYSVAEAVREQEVAPGS